MSTHPPTLPTQPTFTTIATSGANPIANPVAPNTNKTCVPTETFISSAIKLKETEKIELTGETKTTIGTGKNETTMFGNINGQIKIVRPIGTEVPIYLLSTDDAYFVTFEKLKGNVDVSPTVDVEFTINASNSNPIRLKLGYATVPCYETIHAKIEKTDPKITVIIPQETLLFLNGKHSMAFKEATEYTIEFGLWQKK